MTSPSLSPAAGGAAESLPDPMAPAQPDAETPRGQVLRRGDVRWASWVALPSAFVVLAWYVSIIMLGGVYLGEYSVPAQVAVWALAAVAFGCGIVCLNARRNREFAAAGFIAGVVALLVSLTIGLPTGFQVLW